MTDTYDQYETEEATSGAGFMMGLLAGTVIGAGLGMLLAPKAGADLRGQIGNQARQFGTKASEQYRRASEAASGWAERGREVVNQAREAIARGAETAREYTGATTGSTYSSSAPGAPGSYGGSTTGSDYGRS